MAEEDDTGSPPKCEGESAADIRMLFEVNIADIRESKAHEWRITFLVFLLFGAMVAAGRLLPDYLDRFIFAAVLIAGLVAIGLIWIFQSTIVNRRNRLRGLEVHLCVPAHGQLSPKHPWHDWWLPSVLAGFIVLGMVAPAYIVLLPQPQLGR